MFVFDLWQFIIIILLELYLTRELPLFKYEDLNYTLWYKLSAFIFVCIFNHEFYKRLAVCATFCDFIVLSVKLIYMKKTRSNREFTY